MRAGSAGFVREVYVQSGQQVEPGQELVRLDNPELGSELDDLKLEIINRSYYTDGGGS